MPRKGTRPPRKLTVKQELFIKEYLVDLNGGQAVLRAGYKTKTPMVMAYQLLNVSIIRAAVDAAKQKRAAKLEVSAEFVLRELVRIANTDLSLAYDANGHLKNIHDIPEDVRRAISGIEVDELFEGKGRNKVRIGDTVKIKFWDKAKALEMLGRHLALFNDKLKVDANVNSTARVILTMPSNGSEALKK